MSVLETKDESEDHSQRIDTILPPTLLTAVIADWGSTEDALRVMMTSRLISRSLDWEYIFKCLVQRRGGLPLSTKQQLREEHGSWAELCTQLDKRKKNRHLLRCICCNGFPIDGPVYSCLHCYGSDWVMCEECEKTSSRWHPQSHVLIKWPKAYETSRVHNGRFCYQKLNWGPKQKNDTPLHCSDCGLLLTNICVGCIDCGTELCLSCGIGNTEYCSETKEGKKVLKRLSELGPMNAGVKTGDGRSVHADHRRFLHPPISIPRKEQQQHRCSCNICGRVPAWTDKRYRCALCYDFDRCQQCQDRVDQETKPRHAHPMLVIEYAAQRQHIDRVNNFLALSHAPSDYDSDSDFEEVEEDEETSD